MVLQRFREPRFQHGGFIDKGAAREYAQRLIEQYDVRSGQGPVTVARSMSGGNQQKAIIARELDREKSLVVAVQPTRGGGGGGVEAIPPSLLHHSQPPGQGEKSHFGFSLGKKNKQIYRMLSSDREKRSLLSR